MLCGNGKIPPKGPQAGDGRGPRERGHGGGFEIRSLQRQQVEAGEGEKPGRLIALKRPDKTIFETRPDKTRRFLKPTRRAV